VELLLIRHALPVREKGVDGPADPALSAVGQAQADHLAKYLSAEHLDAIYASPLVRARQTADVVAGPHALTVELCADVAEYDRHSGEYVPAEDLKAANDPRFHAVASGDWGTVHESAAEFRQRIVDAVECLVAAHPAQRVAVVCHGAVINTYLCHVLGLGDTGAFFYPNYTSINRVAASRAGMRSIVTLNETSHLRGTGLPMGLFQGNG
jgi:probable phosphoglycerate mutase